MTTARHLDLLVLLARLSPEDRAACDRDILLVGNAFVQLAPDGAKRIPPDELAIGQRHLPPTQQARTR